MPMIMYLTGEDRGAATILVLHPNYTSKWYFILLTNSTVIYYKEPVAFKTKIQPVVRAVLLYRSMKY